MADKINTEDKIEKLMNYLEIVRDNGELDIFVALFQTDFRIMKYLANHPDAHPSIMAEELKVTRPNIAANLRLLEQKGFITRIVDEDNRRQVYVNMTEDGATYLRQCNLQLTFLFKGWFAILGEEETDHLLKILELSSNPEIMTQNLKDFTFGE